MPEQSDETAELITLDTLTRRVGMSVRNIRFYTTKGLVPPPIRRGRSGYYSPDHVVDPVWIERAVAREHLVHESDDQVDGLHLVQGAVLLALAPGGADRVVHEGLRLLSHARLSQLVGDGAAPRL